MALDLSQYLNDPQLLMRLAGAMRARRAPAMLPPPIMGDSMYPTQQPVQAGGLPPLMPQAQPMTSLYPQTAGSNILDQLALAFGNIDPRAGYPARGPRNFWEAFGPNFVAGAGRAFATPRLQRMVDEGQHQQAQQESFKQQQKDYTQAASDLAKRRWELALAQARKAPGKVEVTPEQKGQQAATVIDARNKRLRELGQPVPGTPRPKAPKGAEMDAFTKLRNTLRAAGTRTQDQAAAWLDEPMSASKPDVTNRDYIIEKFGLASDKRFVAGFAR